MLGGPTRGRLSLTTRPDGGLRPGGLDVGMAGSILVVDARVDAETLTRARAMGVRGIVVPGLASKERRDFLASEARQRAALHRLPPYAVLVMDGAARRPMARPIMALLAAMVGREAAIVADPPMLLFDAPDLVAPVPPPDLVRIRAGALSGQEGMWLGPAGRRRFAGGVDLEAGRVRLADGHEVGRAPRRPGAVRLAVAGRHRPMRGTLAVRLPSPRCPRPACFDDASRAPIPPRPPRSGRSLAAVAGPGDLLCLWGDLGAGKTHLAKAFGAALGVHETVTSPSFVLMAEYDGRLPMFHVDLYRLAGAADALAGGLLDDRWVGGVTLVEWPDRLGPAIPPERLDVLIEGSGDDPREIELIAHGDRHRRYLEALG